MKYAAIKRDKQTFKPYWDGPTWLPVKVSRNEVFDHSRSWPNGKKEYQPSYFSTIKAVEVFNGAEIPGVKGEEPSVYFYCRTDEFPLIWVWWWFYLRIATSVRYVEMALVYLLEVWGLAYVPYNSLASWRHIGQKYKGKHPDKRVCN